MIRYLQNNKTIIIPHLASTGRWAVNAIVWLIAFLDLVEHFGSFSAPFGVQSPAAIVAAVLRLIVFWQ